MSICVTEDGLRGRRAGASDQHRNTRRSIAAPRNNKVGLFALAVLCSGLLLQHSALAQDGKLEAKVREIEAEKSWIHLPVNKSVIIETTIPVNLVQTASPEIANVVPLSPTQVLVTGESFGRTQIILGSPDGQQQVFDVSVELELDRLIEAIKRTDPTSVVEVNAVMDTVMLTGTVSDAAAADRVMQITGIFATDVQNHLRVAGEQQVMLRCTIAEVSRSAIKQLGINGFLAGDNFKDMFFVNNVSNINPTSIGAAAGLVTQNLPFVTPGTSIGDNTAISFGFPRVQMQVFVQALKQNGLLRILAEPTLVTLSGRTASFLAGGEFPVPVPQTGTGGATTITIEYREFGARLSFTPVVLSNQQIRLTVAPEVSELDFASGVQIAGFVVPGLTSRRAETTVEIGNGQTMVMAGLLSESVRAFANKVPGLGEVPVLGALFSSVEYRKNVTELVILVTPSIVAPVGADEIGPIPGEGLTSPTDWQLGAFGILEGDPPESSPKSEDSEDMSDADGTEPVDQSVAQEMPLYGPWGSSDYEETP